MTDRLCRCGHPKEYVGGDAGGHFRGAGECMASTPTVTWACGCHAYDPAYELADFDPSDGHLHSCMAARFVDGVRRISTAGSCACADHLYVVAEAAHGELARLRWFMAHRFERTDAGDAETLLAAYERANPAWIDWQLAGREGDAPPMHREVPPDARMLTAGGVMVTPTGEAASARELIDVMPPVRRTTGPTQ